MPRNLRLPVVTVDPDANFHSMSLYLDEDSPRRTACPVCDSVMQLHWTEVETRAFVTECLTCGAAEYHPALVDLI